MMGLRIKLARELENLFLGDVIGTAGKYAADVEIFEV